MAHFRCSRSLAIALCVNAVLLAGVMVVMLTRESSPRLIPAAMGQVPQQTLAPAGGAGLFLMPAQFSDNVWGCYIMDVDQQTLCAYTVSGNPPQMKLVAARDFRYDRRLRNFNTASPAPQEVRDRVEKELHDTRAGGAAARPVPPQAAP